MVLHQVIRVDQGRVVCSTSQNLVSNCLLDCHVTARQRFACGASAADQALYASLSYSLPRPLPDVATSVYQDRSHIQRIAQRHRDRQIRNERRQRVRRMQQQHQLQNQQNGDSVNTGLTTSSGAFRVSTTRCCMGICVCRCRDHSKKNVSDHGDSDADDDCDGDDADADCEWRWVVADYRPCKPAPLLLPITQGSTVFSLLFAAAWTSDVWRDLRRVFLFNVMVALVLTLVCDTITAPVQLVCMSLLLLFAPPLLLTGSVLNGTETATRLFVRRVAHVHCESWCGFVTAAVLTLFNWMWTTTCVVVAWAPLSVVWVMTVIGQREWSRGQNFVYACALPALYATWVLFACTAVSVLRGGAAPVTRLWTTMRTRVGACCVGRGSGTNDGMRQGANVDDVDDAYSSDEVHEPFSAELDAAQDQATWSDPWNGGAVMPVLRGIQERHARRRRQAEQSRLHKQSTGSATPSSDATEQRHQHHQQQQNAQTARLGYGFFSLIGVLQWLSIALSGAVLTVDLFPAWSQSVIRAFPMSSALTAWLCYTGSLPKFMETVSVSELRRWNFVDWMSWVDRANDVRDIHAVWRQFGIHDSHTALSVSWNHIAMFAVCVASVHFVAAWLCFAWSARTVLVTRNQSGLHDTHTHASVTACTAVADEHSSSFVSL